MQSAREPLRLAAIQKAVTQLHATVERRSSFLWQTIASANIALLCRCVRRTAFILKTLRSVQNVEGCSVCTIKTIWNYAPVVRIFSVKGAPLVAITVGSQFAIPACMMGIFVPAQLIDNDINKIQDDKSAGVIS